MLNLTLLNIIQIEKNVHANVKTFFFSANILSYYNTIYLFLDFFKDFGKFCLSCWLDQTFTTPDAKRERERERLSEWVRERERERVSEREWKILLGKEGEREREKE